VLTLVTHDATGGANRREGGLHEGRTAERNGRRVPAATIRPPSTVVQSSRGRRAARYVPHETNGFVRQA
jgi:hypothetical protein